MEKLSKKEYILKAAKLYGLSDLELELLGLHLDGIEDQAYLERRNKGLFRLYEIYKSEEHPEDENIKMDENGIINLNDYFYERSRRRLADSKIGEFWILGSNLDCFLATVPADRIQTIKEKYRNISEKNNFLLPQVAKSMGLRAVVFYNAKRDDNTYYLSKNFLKEDETFIQGTTILKEKKQEGRRTKHKKIKLESLLDATDKYVRKHYKKYKFSEEEAKLARVRIKKELIKQSFFNKYVFNQKESNQKWGLIEDATHHLKAAPLYSYDFCCGAEPVACTEQRYVKDKGDIQSFMLEYGQEKWFRNWVHEKVLTLDLDTQITEMEKHTKVTLTPEEKQYYTFMFQQFKDRVKEIVEVSYDENEAVTKRKARKRIKQMRRSMTNKLNDAILDDPNYDDNDDYGNR